MIETAFAGSLACGGEAASMFNRPGALTESGSRMAAGNER